MRVDRTSDGGQNGLVEDDRKKNEITSREMPCPHCRGSGAVTFGCGAIPCAVCGGTGLVPESDDTMPDGEDKRRQIG